MLKKNNLKAMAFALCATTMAGLYAAPVFAATDNTLKASGSISGNVVVTGGSYKDDASVSLGLGDDRAVKVEYGADNTGALHTVTTVGGELMLDPDGFSGTGEAFSVGKKLQDLDKANGQNAHTLEETGAELKAVKRELYGTGTADAPVGGLKNIVTDTSGQLQNLENKVNGKDGIDGRLTKIEKDKVANITFDGKTGITSVSGDFSAGGLAVDGLNGMVYTKNGMTVQNGLNVTSGGAVVNGDLEVKGGVIKTDSIQTGNITLVGDDKVLTAPNIKGEKAEISDRLVVGNDVDPEKNVTIENGVVKAPELDAEKADIGGVNIEKGVVSTGKGADKITVGDGKIQVGTQGNNVTIQSGKNGTKVSIGTKDDKVVIKDGNIDATGAITTGGSATVGQDLIVNGTTNLKNTKVDGTLDVTGKATLENDLQVNGNTVMDGTLNVKKDADFDANVNVDGNAVIDGTLSAADGKFTVDAAGNTNVEGTLDVTGKATLKDDLQVNGDTVMDGTLNVKDNADFDKDVNIDGKLDVTGKATLKDDLQVNGDTVMDGTLNVKDNADFDANVNVDGKLDVTGKATLKDDLQVNGDTVMDGTLNVKDNADFDANVNVDGNAVIDGTLSAADGDFTVDEDGNTKIKGSLLVKNGTDKFVVEDDLVQSSVGGANIHTERYQDNRFIADAAMGENKGDGTYEIMNKDGSATIHVDGTVDSDGNVVPKKIVSSTVGDEGVVNSAINHEKGKGALSRVTIDGVYNAAGNSATGNKATSELDAKHAQTTVGNDNKETTLYQDKEEVGIGGHNVKTNNEAYVAIQDIGDGGYRITEAAKDADNNGYESMATVEGAQTIVKNETSLAGQRIEADNIITSVGNKDGHTSVIQTADKGLIVIDGNTVDDDPANATNITGTNVSIADQENAGERIELSDLGQIDNVDSELAYEMDNRMYADEDTLTPGVAHNAVNAINAEAQIRRREIDRLDTKIESVGAMSAAIANLRTMGYDPAAPSEFSMSVGHYRGETAMAAGFFHYPHKDFMVSMSVSYGHDELMGGVGATWKFGHRTPAEIARIERERQAEKAMVAAEKAAEAEEAERVAAQAARHQAMLEEEA